MGYLGSDFVLYYLDSDYIKSTIWIRAMPLIELWVKQTRVDK